MPGLSIPINALWQSGTDRDWKTALDHYWTFVQPRNMALVRELDELKVERIASLDPTEWYDFLHDKYFRWKYTAPNRYATTTVIGKQQCTVFGNEECTTFGNKGAQKMATRMHSR